MLSMWPLLHVQVLSMGGQSAECVTTHLLWASALAPSFISLDHRYRGEIPKLAAIFSWHGEQFGGIRFYSKSACVNCIFLQYERVFNRARKAATSATHIKVIACVICIAHSPHLFSAKSRIPQIAPHAGKKIYVGGIETLGSLSLYLWFGHSPPFNISWICPL